MPPFTTDIPAGAVAASAYPSVRAMLSPSTTTSRGWTFDCDDRKRWATGAAVAGTTVPAMITATVTMTATSAGAIDLTDRQNVPFITGRSTR